MCSCKLFEDSLVLLDTAQKRTASRRIPTLLDLIKEEWLLLNHRAEACNWLLSTFLCSKRLRPIDNFFMQLELNLEDLPFLSKLLKQHQPLIPVRPKTRKLWKSHLSYLENSKRQEFSTSFFSERSENVLWTDIGFDVNPKRLCKALLSKWFMTLCSLRTWRNRAAITRFSVPATSA